MTAVRLTLIAVMDQNRLVADETGIPWRLPADVAHFRRYCEGKWILVGRKTFGEMEGWFGNRTPLVLTNACGWDPPIGRAVASVPQAIALAEAAGQLELVCIGGGQVFAASLPMADCLLLTHVHHAFSPKGTPAYFPALSPAEWVIAAETDHAQDQENPWSFTVTQYIRPPGKMAASSSAIEFSTGAGQ